MAAMGVLAAAHQLHPVLAAPEALETLRQHRHLKEIMAVLAPHQHLILVLVAVAALMQ
jgi:hypothetical protein